MFVVLDSLKLALENTEVISIYSIFLLMASLNSTVYAVWLHVFPYSFTETKGNLERSYIFNSAAFNKHKGNRKILPYSKITLHNKFPFVYIR